MKTMYPAVEVGVETLCPRFQPEFWEECTKLEPECSLEEGKTSFKMKAKPTKKCL